MEKKPELVQISSAWSSRDGAPLGRNRYVELELRKTKTKSQTAKASPAQKPCEKMTEAIVMDGGKRGQIVKVCADPSSSGIKKEPRSSPLIMVAIRIPTVRAEHTAGIEDAVLTSQSDTEAFHGRLLKAREFSRRAVDSALHSDTKETAAVWQANAALHEVELGNAPQAKQQANAALALAMGGYEQAVAALALARARFINSSPSLRRTLNHRREIFCSSSGRVLICVTGTPLAFLLP